MSVETTLLHGLQTSLLSSAYKAEYDQNLNLLDVDRFSSGPIASRPAAGKAKRFWFDPATKLISYDNGTQWIEDISNISQLVVESASILNQDLTNDADVNFNSITVNNATLNTPLPTSSGGTGMASKEMFRCDIEGGVNIPSGIPMSLPLANSAQSFDASGNMVDTTNNWISIPVNGYYLMGATVAIDNLTNIFRMSIGEVFGTGSESPYFTATVDNLPNVYRASGSFFAYFTSGQQIKVWVDKENADPASDTLFNDINSIFYGWLVGV